LSAAPDPPSVGLNAPLLLVRRGVFYFYFRIATIIGSGFLHDL
jgi:hypothetical protein